MGYAAFIKRCGAYVLDQLIIAVIILPLAYLLFNDASAYSNQFQSSFLGLYILIGWIYFAKQESSPAQATWGKKLLAIKVTDSNGERISFAKASGRFFSRFISAMLYGIGFLMAAWTEQKQALHDKMCDTYVVTSETDASFFKATSGPKKSTDHIPAQLKSLDELRLKGVLTDSEFEESKKKLLAKV
jgi:uncharacterized RDD family membrane protein YckC